MNPARPCLGRRLFVMSAGLTLLSLSPRSVLVAASPVSAGTVVQDLAKRSWELLHRNDLDQRHRLDQLTQLLTSATDVPLLSRLVLGRHWQALTEAQRMDYEQLFEAVVIRNLARRLDQYANGVEGPLDQHFQIQTTQPLDVAQLEALIDEVVLELKERRNPGQHLRDLAQLASRIENDYAGDLNGQPAPGLIGDLVLLRAALEELRPALKPAAA
jgi:ABC-type transporter MlaC component